MTRETRDRATKPARPLPRNESPEFYGGLGRAIKVARTARGIERKELAELAGVSYAYLSDIETGRGRPGSRSFLAIAEALALSPSTLMREAEIYRARIAGEEVEQQRVVPASSSEGEIQDRVAMMSEAAPSATARRWFHAGRLLAEAEMDLVSEETDEHLSELGPVGDETSQEELRRLVEGLSPTDVEVVLALVRRLRSQ